MTAQIGQMTVSGETDQYIDMNNSVIDRKILEETSWTKIRIGIRFCTTRSSDWSETGLRFLLGVSCSAKPLPAIGAASCHFVGRTSLTSWDLYGYSGNNWLRIGCNVCAIVNGTLTTNGSHGDPQCLPNASAGRGGWIVEITKGSPNFTISTYATNVNDLTPAEFKTAMETPNGSTPVGFSLQNNATTIAVDEATNGDLDSVCAIWHKSAASIYINDIDYAVLA